MLLFLTSHVWQTSVLRRPCGSLSQYPWNFCLLYSNWFWRQARAEDRPLWAVLHVKLDAKLCPKIYIKKTRFFLIFYRKCCMYWCIYITNAKSKLTYIYPIFVFDVKDVGMDTKEGPDAFCIAIKGSHMDRRVVIMSPKT